MHADVAAPSLVGLCSRRAGVVPARLEPDLSTADNVEVIDYEHN